MVKRVLAVALILVFAVALAAYAQNLPKRAQSPLAKPRIAQPGGVKPEGLMNPNNPAERAQQFYRWVYLQRYLMPPGKGEIERLAIALGLTEEQKQRIHELFMQFRTKAQPAFEQKGLATKEVLDILQSPSPSKGALTTAANKVAQAEAVILDAEFDFWLAFRAVLTGQQQTAFAQFMQQKAMREMGPPRQGPGPGPGPGGPPPAP